MTILSDNQRKVLSCLSREKTICDNFYLTGGTALSEFYLSHRLSEDLDFFSEHEFDPEAVSVILQKLKKKVGIKNIRHEQSFNRNLFFLELQTDTIKIEFTYFPFPRIENKREIGKLQIDSLEDIAVNKIFTIYQKPRSRDFIDLYFIVTRKKLKIPDLIKKAQIKFDHHIDLIQLGAQFLKALELKDYPRIIKPIGNKVWQAFFKDEAKKFSSRIFNE